MNSWAMSFITADNKRKGHKTRRNPQEGKQNYRCSLIIFTSVIPESDLANSCMNGMGSSTWIASAFSISTCQENKKLSKWFEPWCISSSYCVIVRVRVVLKRTVVGDWRFDNLNGSHLRSQVNNVCQLILTSNENKMPSHFTKKFSRFWKITNLKSGPNKHEFKNFRAPEFSLSLKVINLFFRVVLKLTSEGVT